MNRESVRHVSQRIVAVLRWLYVPAALVLLAAAAWRARELFPPLLAQSSSGALGIAIVLWALLHLLTPALNRIVFRELGSNIGYVTLLRIHANRLPARYLPGGIWHTVARVADLSRLGASRAQLSILVLLENTVAIALASLLGGLFLALAGGAVWTSVAILAAGLLLLGCIWLLLQHRRLRQVRKFSGSSFLRLAAATAAFWLLAATAFYCYWSAFPVEGEGISSLHIYGVYLLAWAAGFVAVFAPQGIGVFEAVTGHFLQGTMSFAAAAVLAAGFRAVILAADLLVFLASLACDRAFAKG